MNKKLISIAFFALSLAILVTPVLAETTYYDHANATGTTVIDLKNHQPRLMILAEHYDRGDHGKGDALTIFLWAAPLNTWIAVAGITDNPEGFDYSKTLYGQSSLIANNLELVKTCQLQVGRIGKAVFACWTNSLTATITGPWIGILGVTSVTLPAGCLMFLGYGQAISDTTILPLPTGYTFTIQTIGFMADATLLCPSWHYFGPVGSSSMPTKIGVDVDATVVGP
jgi:hypothetical protein